MKYICVSPQAELEIWSAGFDFEIGHPVWKIEINDQGSYLFCSWCLSPDFWGREILEEWRE